MDLRLLVEIALLVALLIAAGFFAGSETALFSLSRVKREAMQARGEATDRAVLRLLGHSRRLQVLLSLGGALAVVGIALTTTGIGGRVHASFGLARPIVVIAAVVVVTVPVVVLLGSMTPRAMALRFAEPWARLAAIPLEVLGVLLAPLRLAVSLVGNGLLNLVGGRPASPDQGIREEEFRALIDVGEREGEVENAERRLIHNVFEFGDRTVAEVMTPQDKVFVLPYDLPLGRLVEQIAASRFSRVPVYKKGARGAGIHVVGVVYAKDLVGYRFGHLEGHSIQDLIKPPFFVPRSTRCDRLFREFQRRKTHMALVVDEYGRLVGLVTMEDLLEQLFGAISDERDAPPRSAT